MFACESICTKDNSHKTRFPKRKRCLVVQRTKLKIEILLYEMVQPFGSPSCKLCMSLIGCKGFLWTKAVTVSLTGSHATFERSHSFLFSTDFKTVFLHRFQKSYLFLALTSNLLSVSSLRWIISLSNCLFSYNVVLLYKLFHSVLDQIISR